MVSKTHCECCGGENSISNIISKIRPILLWLDQGDWYNSMSFAIPLSTTNPSLNNKYAHPILLSDFTFFHNNKSYQRPMRAVIHQATRVDGNVLNSDKLIGKLNNSMAQQYIENKLLDWIFK
jgi:hypothetical protein